MASHEIDRPIDGGTEGTPVDAADAAAAHGADEEPDTRVTLVLPAGTVPAVDMLPVFRTMTDAMVARAIADSIAQGKPPTCRAGCAACCRHQAVPISTIEARRIAAVVEALPQPRRSAVQARFADADQHLRRWYESLDQTPGTAPAAGEDRYAAYFGLGIACPLLEDDCCSIYEERPLVCREYVATTPAENCARLEEQGVHVEIVARLFTDKALASLVSDDSPPQPAQILLPQALRWAGEHPEPDPMRHGAETWMERFFARLRQSTA